MQKAFLLKRFISMKTNSITIAVLKKMTTKTITTTTVIAIAIVIVTKVNALMKI
jgi:hypothetical protein